MNDNAKGADNMNTSTTTSSIVALCHDSERAWEDAIDGAEIDGNKKKEAATREAADECGDYWAGAIRAVQVGDFPAAIQCLVEAAKIAVEFGSDEHEQQAITELVSRTVRADAQDVTGERGLRPMTTQLSTDSTDKSYTKDPREAFALADKKGGGW